VALAAMAFGEYCKAIDPDAPSVALAVGVVWLVSIVQLCGSALVHLPTDLDRV